MKPPTRYSVQFGTLTKTHVDFASVFSFSCIFLMEEFPFVPLLKSIEFSQEGPAHQHHCPLKGPQFPSLVKYDPESYWHQAALQSALGAIFLPCIGFFHSLCIPLAIYSDPWWKNAPLSGNGLSGEIRWQWKIHLIIHQLWLNNSATTSTVMVEFYFSSLFIPATRYHLLYLNPLMVVPQIGGLFPQVVRMIRVLRVVRIARVQGHPAMWGVQRCIPQFFSRNYPPAQNQAPVWYTILIWRGGFNPSDNIFLNELIFWKKHWG